MKKLSFFVVSVLCLSLSVSVPTDAQSFVSEVVSWDVLHTHTPEDGSCYTPVYHYHEGSAEDGGACYQTPVYHVHDGNTTSGGACYLGSVCGGTTKTLAGTHYLHGCTVCGYQMAMGNANGEGPNVPATPGDICSRVKCSKVTYKLNCGKTEETIDSYSMSCTKTEGEHDGYTLVCTRGNTSVGRVTMSKVRDEVDYTLSIIVEDVSLVSAVWSTGDLGLSIDITENGTYSCDVVVTDFAGCSYTKTLSYTVTDIDIIPPVYECLSRKFDRCTYEQLSVNFSDNYGVTSYMLEKE